MKTVSKSKLKARMLEYFREVERTGETLEVTDRGRPVLRIVPVRKSVRIEDLQAKYAGKASEEFLDAVLEPMEPADYKLSWE